MGAMVSIDQQAPYCDLAAHTVRCHFALTHLTPHMDARQTFPTALLLRLLVSPSLGWAATSHPAGHPSDSYFKSNTMTNINTTIITIHFFIYLCMSLHVDFDLHYSIILSYLYWQHIIILKKYPLTCFSQWQYSNKVTWYVSANHSTPNKSCDIYQSFTVLQVTRHIAASQY